MSVFGLMLLLSRERTGRIEQKEMAGRGALTGLANRALFGGRLSATGLRWARVSSTAAVRLIDPDEFKAIK
ncbi:MAG: GGDEF domain-containing protein [Actinomycetota bacterium]|nr:GGDEF domain-containing protein [Actinomycetota bacterium]